MKNNVLYVNEENYDFFGMYMYSSVFVKFQSLVDGRGMSFVGRIICPQA